jgi:hypothetical protein
LHEIGAVLYAYVWYFGHLSDLLSEKGTHPEMAKARKKNSVGPGSRRGAIMQRLITTLARDFPEMHTRASLIQALELDPKERPVFVRTLGRLIRAKKGKRGELQTVGEALYPLIHPAIDLPFTGLVSATVNLVGLREEWKKRDKMTGDKEASGPNQEGIVSEIITATKTWTAKYMEGHKEQHKNRMNRCPIVLLDISLVHGSNEIDLLLTILYRDNTEFMRYIREVVQRAPHIQGTHTMQIGMRKGFRNFEPPALA